MWTSTRSPFFFIYTFVGSDHSFEAFYFGECSLGERNLPYSAHELLFYRPSVILQQHSSLVCSLSPAFVHTLHFTQVSCCCDRVFSKNNRRRMRRRTAHQDEGEKIRAKKTRQKALNECHLFGGVNDVNVMSMYIQNPKLDSCRLRYKMRKVRFWKSTELETAFSLRSCCKRSP